jgi:DNA-directed RNA polymerase specialized sigma24 family protein
MSVEISSAVAGPRGAVFDAIFKGLPALDSPGYRELIDNAPVNELPAQVLARAFRELIASGSHEAAEATLLRLVADKRFDYLGIVRRLANQHVVKGTYSYDADDLIQETIAEIVKTLPTARGAVAEGAWVLFIRHRFEDARRKLYGRRGEKDPAGRVEPSRDQETGEIVDPVEEIDGALADWHVQLRESKESWLQDFVRRTAGAIVDPLIRYVAIDQFGDDPSPISAGTSEGGKAPLTEQLGIDRFKISRALKSAKRRLAAELMTQNEPDVDVEWLRKFTE